mgnify:CR=1 FL=1
MDLLKFDIDKSPKIYYSIGELAKMLNVNTSLVRFWEKEFEILKPKKNNKGNKTIQFKKKLQSKDFKFTPGAKKRIEDLGGSAS